MELCLIWWIFLSKSHSIILCLYLSLFLYFYLSLPLFSFYYSLSLSLLFSTSQIFSRAWAWSLKNSIQKKIHFATNLIKTKKELRLSSNKMFSYKYVISTYAYENTFGHRILIHSNFLFSFFFSTIFLLFYLLTTFLVNTIIHFRL